MAAAPKSRAAKPAEKAATDAVETMTEMAKGAMDVFAYPKLEMPEMVRSFAEEGLKQTREAYARVKTAAEEATDLLEDTMETNRKAMQDAQLKMIDMAKANTDATFELVRKLLGTSSASEAFELQTAFARERAEAVMGYAKDMQEMMAKAGAEVGKPAKAIFEKTMSFGKAA